MLQLKAKFNPKFQTLQDLREKIFRRKKVKVSFDKQTVLRMLAISLLCSMLSKGKQEESSARKGLGKIRKK